MTTHIGDARMRLAQLCQHYPLLAAKLSRPRALDTWVPRPRLMQRLEAVGRTPLSAIVAPAGYGKTTLAGQWAAQADMPVGWVSLDVGDNAVQRFWLHALAALELARPGVAEAAMTQLHAAHAPVQAVLQRMLNALTLDESNAPVVLVLDDLHVIADQTVLATLADVIDALPSHAHVLVASRAEPALPLARLRARQQVIELSEADLRFDADESAALLNGAMRLALPDDAVVALSQRTEGWAAGLQLAALSLHARESDGMASVVANFEGDRRHVADYLTAEVLNKQSAARQRFLLQTSLLDQLNAGLCDAVTGRQDSARMLRALERDHLFLTPLGTDGKWYRYHHLFGGFLRECLEDAYPDEAPELHRRAATWHAQHGLAELAMRHAFAANDPECIGRTALHLADDLWRREELAVLRDWLERTPQLLEQYPDVALYHAWSLFLTGRLDGIEARVTRVEQLIHDEVPPLTGISSPELRGMLFVVKGSLGSTLRQDARAAFEWYDVALSLLPAARAIWRGAALIGIGLSNQYAGNITAAVEAYRQGVSVSRAAGNTFGALFAMSQLADLTMAQTRLREAEATLRDAIAIGTGLSGQPLPMAAWAHAGLGAVHYQRNALESAQTCFDQALALAGDVASAEMAHIGLANIAQARGQHDAALAELDLAARAVHNSPLPSFDVDIAVARAAILMRQSKLDVLGNWGRERGLDPNAPDAARLAEYMTAARVACLGGQPEEALAWLNAALPLARAVGHHALLIHARLTQALAQHGLRNATAALDALGQAMAAAEGEGVVRPFLDAGATIHLLVQQHVAQRGASAFAARLLAAFSAPAVPPSLLSERELEILRLIEAGLSNKQIGEALFIGIGTVKWHINNILGKLGATTRTSALARARERKLL
jgi:LuxR family maltose regulon positive regulatory protein